jgi:hypothetical protein
VSGKHLRDDDTTTTDDVSAHTPDPAPTVTTDENAVRVARRRFGGFDLPAAFAGMLAGLGLTVLLAGIAGAAGSVGYQSGASADDLSNGGLVTGLVILLLSFLAGGWVAGRMARYDGGLNGTTAGVLFVLLAAAVSGVGSWLDKQYDFFQDVRLPNWFSGPSTAEAVITAIIGIAVVLLAAGLGGLWGARYHRRADALIATTRHEAVTTSAPARDSMVRGDADVAMDRSDARERAGRRAVR